MSEYRTVGRWPHVNGGRKLHTDANCRRLKSANNTREPTEAEIEEMPVCDICSGDWQAVTTPDYSLNQALQDADPDEVLSSDGGQA